MLIGEDATGIGAVTLSAEQAEGPSVVKLQAVAIATYLRGQGGGYADAALQAALEAAGARASAAGLNEFLAVGWIDSRNKPSKLMCERAGFSYLRTMPSGLEEWGVTVEL
jgi:hypothetical protein